MTKPLVFISHSSLDKEVATQVASELRTRGLDVWIDHERIRYGESIPKAIETGLDLSSCILVVVSSAFLKSSWCRTEYEPLLVREIESDRILVIPLLIEDCALPTLLSHKLYADLRESARKTSCLDKVARQILDLHIHEPDVSPVDSFESNPKESSQAESPGQLLLTSLQRRLENDFFVSGQRRGEFGKTRLPNEAHLYHGTLREVLRHKPYYFLTYWGWEVMPFFLAAQKSG